MSIFFAFYSRRDQHHQDALGVLTHAFEGRWGRPHVTDYILDEALTLLKNKISPRTALVLHDLLENTGPVRLVRLDEPSLKRSIEIFRNQVDKSGFSFTDATTVSIMREYAIQHLASLDQRSFAGILPVIGPGYWERLTANERKRIMRLASEFLSP